MTILPLYHAAVVKKPPDIQAAAAAADPTILKAPSDAQYLIPADVVAAAAESGGVAKASRKKVGCCDSVCEGPNRSMWITVGFLTFAFLTMMAIQNIVGYLAYHGYGVRNDYGIVLRPTSGEKGGGRTAEAGTLEGVAFSWPHLPWNCSPEKLAPLREDSELPVIFKHNGKVAKESDVITVESMMDNMRPLLRHAAFHIPIRSHKDSTLYIVGSDVIGNNISDVIKSEEEAKYSLEKIQADLKSQIGREFRFQIEFVEEFGHDLGSFIDNAEKHILNLLHAKCPKADELGQNIDPTFVGHHE